MLVAWDDSEHALGYDVIDAGHRLVIDSINRLNNCTGGDADRDVVAEVMRMLQAHLPQQFHHEETLMTMGRSPRLPGQRDEHGRFLATLSAHASAFEAGEAVGNLLLLNLVAFLKTHLRGTDVEEFGPDMLQAA